MDILAEIWPRFLHCATFLNLDITIWAHVILRCHGNTQIFQAKRRPWRQKHLLRKLGICGACREWSVPIRRHYCTEIWMPNMVITSCAYVQLFLSVAWKQGRKEARKQSLRQKLERENEGMNLESWNLGMKMHPVPARLIYGNNRERMFRN